MLNLYISHMFNNGKPTIKNSKKTNKLVNAERIIYKSNNDLCINTVK